MVALRVRAADGDDGGAGAGRRSEAVQGGQARTGTHEDGWAHGAVIRSRRGRFVIL